MRHAGTVARRYAEAYFALAEEAGDTAGWGIQLALAAEAAGNERVAAALSNPRLAPAERMSRAESLLDGVDLPARNLTRLLVERGRARILPEVAEHYQRLVDRASGIVRAEVTVAVDVDDRLKESIATTLSEHLGTAVTTEVRRDPSIVGGLVIRVGDRVIDDSVRTHLQQLQAALA